MTKLAVPSDFDAVMDKAWKAARDIPGFLVEDEARFLGLMAACAPRGGNIVEIGSFKGKSTVILAMVAGHYGLGPIVAIDPHNFHSPELQEHRTAPGASSYEEFLSNLQRAGVAELVEVHRAYSGDMAAGWSRPIRFLWIDGDHGYGGAKSDFDGYAPHVLPYGIVALHDALHEFSGPIRVFVEDVLRSDRYGEAGFVRSIAWAQFRPEDGALFSAQRAGLERTAARLIPFVKDDIKLRGLKKLGYKARRALVPRTLMEPRKWIAAVNRGAAEEDRA